MRRTSYARVVALAFAWAALSLAGVGCSSSGVTLQLEAGPDTNGGRPLYVVVRQVEPARFASDSYGEIAHRAFARPKDETVLRTEVLYPGAKRKLRLKDPDPSLPIALYFLFTDPGERWKVKIDPPLPTSVEIRLDSNEVAAGP